MTRVKICGILRPDHALGAAQAGADYIGLVFVPNRHRRLTIPAAREIVDELKSSFPSSTVVVGLFADQPREEVVHAIQSCRLDAVQLCGHETLDYCGRVPVPVIKVFHVPNPPYPPLVKGGRGEVSPFEEGAPGRNAPFEINSGPAHVPPFRKGGPGGIFAPSEQPEEGALDGFARQVRLYREAGHLVTLDRLVEGLPGGTGESFDWDIAALLSRQGHSFLLAGGLTPDNVAQAVAQVQPWGVDVSSGVETGGVKDLEKIRAFIANARLPLQQGAEGEASGPER
jgi:phosphoribosylanthranilate isomerase